MPVSIRLARHGGKKKPFYRIVVADGRYPRDGRRIEQVGIYDPQKNPSRVEFHAERLEKWLRRGARPTATVAQLIRKSRVREATEEETPASPPLETPASPPLGTGEADGVASESQASESQAGEG